MKKGGGGAALYYGRMLILGKNKKYFLKFSLFSTVAASPVRLEAENSAFCRDQALQRSIFA
ncbi:hypothetical protein NIA71_12825 [Ihubacter massiliensis]|uniref:Uncharacterized protein n=1 Tax=Hominibacterium faecale TaxID=2839743 RepID=A0A9J6QNW0_9FIRM|nr:MULTISPECIES: hypothetical protein [Eubacteriales Family XIII. Incertae Sedis]MCI7304327.1 hypothetical protein [Clostridia bacterium]MCO7122827.1 hypothetical protein [Ihubacter massiliensis]MCU7377100.1 hypothetical protein [Hominibacterium faecale]MDY3010929.1 hypothetical protein [Clostridiales Family XIII bacterium]